MGRTAKLQAAPRAMPATTSPRRLRLATLSPSQRWAVLTHLAGHPASPLTPGQQVAVLRALANHRWEPREEETPVPWGLVEAWWNDVLGRRG